MSKTEIKCEGKAIIVCIESCGYVEEYKMYPPFRHYEGHSGFLLNGADGRSIFISSSVITLPSGQIDAKEALALVEAGAVCSPEVQGSGVDTFYMCKDGDKSLFLVCKIDDALSFENDQGQSFASLAEIIADGWQAECPPDTYLRDDAHFDIWQDDGTDIVGGVTGKIYTTAELASIAIANGATFRADGSAITAADIVSGVEMDLKAVDGHGIVNGNKVTAETSDAAYMNNGAWTDIDTLGGRDDFSTDAPTSVDAIFLANCSVGIVHLKFVRI